MAWYTATAGRNGSARAQQGQGALTLSQAEVRIAQAPPLCPDSYALKGNIDVVITVQGDNP
ncbi:hypothetical protein [Ferrimonas pelagia]|uniref:Uncharacterized protein n=1 Tax=Ferrimonas pelagia TaxID=1177826 RepID=A0ABP9FML2_9GAMM